MKASQSTTHTIGITPGCNTYSQREHNIAMSAPQQAFLGVKTPLALEYERQAEERAKEQERMQKERDRMDDDLKQSLREEEEISQKGILPFFQNDFLA
jgi:hypothetical protein